MSITKSIIITGASRGIGREIALEFARTGYNVAICCKNSMTDLKRVKQEVESFSVSCLAFQGDMGTFSDAHHFIEKAINTFGVPDILVNNAGVSYFGLLQDMTPNQWEELINTNLTSVFNCCKAVIPHMLQEKSGKIFNISSVWGNVGASMEVAYSSTKGGINSLTKALAKELAPSHIQVNAIACGIIDTQMNHCLAPEDIDAITAQIPAGRMGSPKEVASLVYNLSQGPEYLTGQVIKLDGGWI